MDPQALLPPECLFSHSQNPLYASWNGLFTISAFSFRTPPFRRECEKPALHAVSIAWLLTQKISKTVDSAGSAKLPALKEISQSLTQLAKYRLHHRQDFQHHKFSFSFSVQVENRGRVLYM